MTEGERIGVVVTTYNWPRALRAVLGALARQTCPAFEVVVADDGSGPSTRQLIDALREDFPVPLSHVWQPDEGFRAAAARNRAVAATQAEYIVFLDGDCLVRPDFIARHAGLAAGGRLVAGNRVLLSEAFSERVLAEGLTPEAWGASRWLAARLRGDVNRPWSLLRLPNARWRDRRAERWRGVKTCNLGLWRADFLAVNGLDERYQGWGYEDSDLVIRLLRHGVKRRDGRFATSVLHLWHPQQERTAAQQNLQRLRAIEQAGPVRAGQGVDGYL